MSFDRSFPFGKIPQGVELVKIIVKQGSEEIFNSTKYPVEDLLFPVKPQYLSVGQQISVFKQVFTIQAIQIQIEINAPENEFIKTLVIELIV